MARERLRRLDLASFAGIPAAALIFVVAQRLEGGTVRSLWQPTAALVVFGGTGAAVAISFPYALLARTVAAVRLAFFGREERLDEIFARLIDFAHKARRRGLMALEADISRVPDPFFQAALRLAADGVAPATTRQILEIESQARRESADGPADVLETAAGYAPTLGILGAVLGLIRVMESLSEPTKLGAGIAVAFVATVYGVGIANLLLLPLSTKLRGQARHEELCREVIIEGVASLQEGLNPSLLEQKLLGYLTPRGEATVASEVA